MLVTQDTFKAVLRDASDTIAIHQNIVLRSLIPSTSGEEIKAHSCQIPMNNVVVMQVDQPASDI